MEANRNPIAAAIENNSFALAPDSEEMHYSALGNPAMGDLNSAPMGTSPPLTADPLPADNQFFESGKTSSG